jgi:hypothetical protein
MGVQTSVVLAANMNFLLDEERKRAIETTQYLK